MGIVTCYGRRAEGWNQKTRADCALFDLLARSLLNIERENRKRASTRILFEIPNCHTLPNRVKRKRGITCFTT